MMPLPQNPPIRVVIGDRHGIRASPSSFFSGKPGAHVRFHGAMGSTHVEKGYRFRAREIIVAGRFVISGKIVPASNVVDSNFLGKGGGGGVDFPSSGGMREEGMYTRLGRNDRFMGNNV